MTTFILCVVWVLWPVLAFVGGLGFAILSAVAVILLLPSALRSMRPRLYMVALLAFLVFAGVSASWSPREVALVDFDFSKLRFDVRSEMIRVGLLVVAIGGLMAAASRMTETGRRRLATVAHAALVVQLIGLVVVTVLETQALEFFSDYMSGSDEGVQNISRNSLIMALAAPVLIAGLLERRSQAAAIAWGLAILGLTIGVLVWLGSNAGLLALAAAGACVILVRLMPRHGFKVIAILVAGVILSAPWLFGYLTQGADFATADDSISYRAAIWQLVIELIQQDPIRGHGLGVLRTIQDRIGSGVFAGQLMVPNHSHNMTLQLWAETGGIGAGLLSLAIVLAGWRMPPAGRMGASAWRAAALVGGMTAIACVSFDLWNEWWWAVGGLLAVLAVGSPREQRVTKEAPRGITFGLDSKVLASAEDVSAASRDIAETSQN